MKFRAGGVVTAGDCTLHASPNQGSEARVSAHIAEDKRGSGWALRHNITIRLHNNDS